jgi:hypothetical protein
MAKNPGHGGSYMLLFTIVNVIFLGILLTLCWFLLG